MRRHSTATLMGLTKKELVEYVRMAEYNQEVAEETVRQQAENVKDWIPVVRCKDCRWAEDFSHSYLRELFADGALNCVIARGDSGYGLNCSVIMPHDFCSDGERREGE